MTEAEWLACEDPRTMLEFLRGKASDRKLRLFAVACCRRHWHLLRETASRHAVLVAERFADALATPQELEDAQEEAVDAGREGDGRGAVACCHFRPSGSYPVGVAQYVAREFIDVMNDRQLVVNTLDLSDDERRAELRAEAEILKYIFGNPFRPIDFDEIWLTIDVFSTARSIYDGREFDRLPELAEALGRAGCDDAEILNHCRGPGPHVRGCWVVDLILGRS